MILPVNIQHDWIYHCSKKYKGDPILIEKVIRALMLLEQLQVAALPFIFKGGTALMLLIQEPRRFSIDIDINIENVQLKLEPIFEQIIKRTSFTRFQENLRESNGLNKRHFKFYYTPATSMRGSETNILLDIVYQVNPYTTIMQTPISHFLLQEEGDCLFVTTPTLPALLGDKLTAYGPYTTGIPFSKPKEIMKQLYDIAIIFDHLEDLTDVKPNFENVASFELAYRNFKAEESPLILADIISTSYNFCSYGKANKEDYQIMRGGLEPLSHFIYGDKFREPEAQRAMAKAAYIATKIESDVSNIEKFSRGTVLPQWEIKNLSYNRLNRLKKANLEAFYYWHKALRA